MKRLLVAGLMAVLALAGDWAYAASLSDFNYLNDVKAYSSESGVRFAIKFKMPIKDFKGPIFYEKSIQIDFPNAYLHPSKRIFQIGDGLIKEVVAYQFTKDVARVRFMLDGSQYDLDKRFTLETRGNKMIFSLKKLSGDSITRLLEAEYTEPEQAEAPTLKKKVETEPATPQPAVAGKEAVSGSAPLPDTLFQSLDGPEKKEGADESGPKEIEYNPGQATPDLLSAGVKIYAMLFVVLALVLFLFYLAKNYFLPRNWLDKEKLVDVIATSPIGSKKSISLVEVAGCVLVLGVSNSQITMLTRIEDAGTVNRLKEYKTRFKKTNPLGGFKFPISLRRKDRSTVGPGADFSSELKRFTSDIPEPEFPDASQTAADLTRLIRERLGKAKKGSTIDLVTEQAGFVRQKI